MKQTDPSVRETGSWRSPTSLVEPVLRSLLRWWVGEEGQLCSQAGTGQPGVSDEEEDDGSKPPWKHNCWLITYFTYLLTCFVTYYTIPIRHHTIFYSLFYSVILLQYTLCLLYTMLHDTRMLCCCTTYTVLSFCTILHTMSYSITTLHLSILYLTSNTVSSCIMLMFDLLYPLYCTSSLSLYL